MRSRGGKRPPENVESVQNSEILGPRIAEVSAILLLTTSMSAAVSGI